MKKLLYILPFFLTFPLSAQSLRLIPTPDDHRPGEILFQTYHADGVPGLLLNLTSSNWASIKDFKLTTVSSNLNIYKISFDVQDYAENDIFEKINRYQGVKVAQYNHIAQVRFTPNDPLFGQQWNLAKIGTPSVWDITTGGLTGCGDTIVVAVLDIGFDINHSDLKANIWHNRFEIPNNDIDDDNNGFKDDYDGWSFETESDNHNVQTHGTNCLGIIGAVGNNNNGITGVNWYIKMLPLSVNDDESIVKAYLYAHDLRKKYNQTNGQKGAYVAVTSMSVGYDNKRPEDFPLICNVYNTLGQQGILSVVAATNMNVDININGDIPGLCPSDYLLVVNRTRQDETVPPAGFSTKFVDLAAPGESIVTTFPNNATETVGGNSFAAPLVAGAAALLFSSPQDSLCKMSKRTPAAVVTIIKDFILRGVDILPVLQNKTVSGGRLNVAKSFQLLSRVYGMPIGEYDILKMYPNPVDQQLVLTIQAPQISEAELIIVNSTGQVISQRKIVEKDLLSNKILVSTGDFTAGLYYISLLAKDYRSTKKFVVTHR